MEKNDTFKDEDIAINNAICSYVVLTLDDRLTDEEYSKIINFIDIRTIKRIDDREFLNNKRLIKNIDFNRIDRKQLVRLMTRDINIMDRVDLNKLNFSVYELEMFFAVHPNHTRIFNFDLTRLTGKEIIIMLKADLNYIYEIDFNDKKFTRLDFQDLIKCFSDIKEVMDKVKFEELDNFLTKTVILNTKEKYINKVKIDKLTKLDWLEILHELPQMIKYCDINIFEGGDSYNIAQLVCILPDYSYLVEKNKNKLSALAWEKLLLYDPEKYSPMCNFEALTSINWKNIIKKKPYLQKFKTH